MEESVDLSFGETIQNLRRKMELSIKELIERLESKRDKKISPAYITRIEQYGEIPSPDLICLMAEVLKEDTDNLLECAKKIKVRNFGKNLESKYNRAVGHYRIQRERK